ncbi:hypothetical protein CISIN_1g038889mg, partial [Citrus sinensis]
TCALRVDTQTSGWHKSLIKVLARIDGVTYSIDAQQGIAYISGKVEPGTLLKLLAKAGKHAELCWVDSGNHNAKNPNNIIMNNEVPSNGYGHGHYNDHHHQGYNYPYSQYGYYFANDPPQRSWHPYPQPELYPAAGAPFYEPSPRYFPQPPAPLQGFNVGDAQ